MSATAEELNEQYNLLIRYIDDDKQYGYFQFMNNYDQQAFKIASNVQSVIIIDTTTNYFNASKLFLHFSITNLTLPNYMKSKAFQILCDEVEKMINDHAYYQISRNQNNDLYYGLYFHPYMLSHLLITINPLIAFKFSEFMKDFYIYQSTNKSINTNSLISNNRYNAINDINEYIDIENIVSDYNCDNIEGIFKRCDPKTKDLLTENSKFDLAQFNKTKNWKQDYICHVVPTSSSSLSLSLSHSCSSSFNITTNEDISSCSQQQYQQSQQSQQQINNRMKLTDSSRHQAIIAIAHYDDRGMYAYGSKSYKLTLDLINIDDLGQYMELWKKPMTERKLSEAEYEDLIFSDRLKVKTDIIAKFINLHDVPYDFIDKFVSVYDNYFEVEIRVIDRVEYVVINNLDKFKYYFSDFLLPYMNI